MTQNERSQRRARITRSIALVSAGVLLAIGILSLMSQGASIVAVFSMLGGVAMLVAAVLSRARE